jgi:hypothetical protein
MSTSGQTALRKPPSDDRPVWDVLFGIWGYPAVLGAHQMKLFELLAERPLTIEEVGAELKIARSPADTLLALCASVGFVAFKDGCYSLTPVAVSLGCLPLPGSPVSGQDDRVDEQVNPFSACRLALGMTTADSVMSGRSVIISSPLDCASPMLPAGAQNLVAITNRSAQMHHLRAVHR